jgi:hypothetical protein
MSATPSKDPNRDAPEAAELSDSALESVAGGCQIGTSIGGEPLKNTIYEPPPKLPIETIIDPGDLL